MTLRPVALAALLLILLSSCGRTVTTSVFPVETPLPEQEEAVYTIQDKDGATIGRAVLAITGEGDALQLTQEYRFGERQTDRSAALVDRRSLSPRSSERMVDDNGRGYRTAATYTAGHVSVTFTGDPGERRREAEVSETSYDNLESLFLWRTMPLRPDESVSYVNVVVDPKGGSISRALATVRVSGREQVRLADGVVEAWRVDFTSAGVTNQAWYAGDDRRLLKYVIARGPTLLLERVSR